MMKKNGSRFNMENTFKKERFEQVHADRIHFLNTGYSDAILLESQGHFAMIDAAEDTEYPPDKPKLKLPGYEQEVLSYLKKHAAAPDGTVTLDFVLGTHAHSDHIGGFDTIIDDEKIVVKQAFLMKYNSSNITDYEKKFWDNQEVYDQMVAALQRKGVPQTDQFPKPDLEFGNFRLKFFNTAYDTSGKKVGENDNSVAVKVTKKERSAFLAGDLDNLSGDEKRIAPLVGHVDLLKLGHHGYLGSSSFGFLRRLSPDLAVATNSIRRVHGHVRFFLRCFHTRLIPTVENNGIIATFTDDGKIIITNDIM